MQKIFVIEDDDNIREMLVYALSSAGFEAKGFCDGLTFQGVPEKEKADLILLDIMLPGEDGLSILKRLKKSSKTNSLPVIMLTAKGSEYDRVSGLDLGADDYITKPFSILEVLSRVRAVLRRCGEKNVFRSTELKVGECVLHTDKRTVFVQGESILLTYKEFELLHYLMLNEGIVLTRDSLLEKVWGFDYNGESRTVDVHIKSLRQKLQGCSGIIKTIRNVGYKAEGHT